MVHIAFIYFDDVDDLFRKYLLLTKQSIDLEWGFVLKDKGVPDGINVLGKIALSIPIPIRASSCQTDNYFYH